MYYLLQEMAQPFAIEIRVFLNFKTKKFYNFIVA